MRLDIVKIGDLADGLLNRAMKLEAEAKEMQDEVNAILDMIEVKPLGKAKPEPEPIPVTRTMERPQTPAKKPDDSTDRVFLLGMQPEIDEYEDLGLIWRPWFNPSHSMCFMSDPNLTDGDLLAFSYFMSSAQISVALKREGREGHRKSFDSFEQVVAECENLIGQTFARETLNNLWYMLERMMAFVHEDDPYGLSEPVNTVDEGGLDIVCYKKERRILVSPGLNPMPGTPEVVIGNGFSYRHVSLLNLNDLGKCRFGEAVDRISDFFGEPISTHSAKNLQVVIRDSFLPNSRGGK